MAEREPEEGRKGGAAEGGMAYPRYYEPTITAVTDMVVPATRVQWGPVFAGLITAIAFTLLFLSLGAAVGLGALGMGFWTIAFATIGLYLGSYLAARTAKAPLLPAIVHSIIIWGLGLIVTTMGAGGLGSVLLSGGPAGTAPAATELGWWFFIGFIIMLAGSILGGLTGMVSHEEHQEVQR